LVYAATVFRFVAGAVFLLAGLAKAARRDEFQDALARYELLPVRWLRPVARWLPAVEIVLGGALLLGFGTRAVAAALAAALVLFSGAVAINLLRGRSFDCGCLAIGAPRRIGWVTIARNVALAAMAVGAAWRPSSTLALDALTPWRPTPSLGSATGIALLLAVLAAVLAATLAEEALRLRTATKNAMGR
jgi:uncharacterized membrane protein YphA (DoxX/SURF4 family)